jgi:AcrR family transcriptional regulator
MSMARKHAKREILEGALATALDVGMSQLSFGRVAARVGINDRTVVYYFPTKDELVREVLAALVERVQAALAAAFVSPAPSHLELLRAAWPVLARTTLDRAFALFFEAIGLAAAGRAPYASIVPGFVEAWIAWAAELIDGSPSVRRAEAEAAIAVVDGLLLVRQMAGPEIADRAARALKVL